MFTSSVLVLLGVGGISGLGVMGIAWTRCGGHVCCWGRRLFFAVLTTLGIGALFAAGRPESGFLYAGLAVGGLLILMLWEGPTKTPESGGWSLESR